MEYFLPEVMSLLELLIVSGYLDVVLNYSEFTVTNPQARHIIFYPCDFAKTDLHLGHCFMSNYLLKIHILFIIHPYFNNIYYHFISYFVYALVSYSYTISSVTLFLVSIGDTFTSFVFLGIYALNSVTISLTLSLLNRRLSQVYFVFCIFFSTSCFSFCNMNSFPSFLNDSSSNENYWDTNLPVNSSNTILCLNFYVSTNLFFSNNLSIAFCLDYSSNHWF